MASSSLPDPATALAVFTAVGLTLAVLLWPRRGLLWQVRKLTRLTQRVQLEDALKHLTNCELAGRTGTVESLGGALETSRGSVLTLLSTLSRRGLVRSDEDGVVLTADGRTYGMRMLRAHRLLERYFADRTGIAPAEWHERAESEEHRLNEAEADHLAASMGNPAVDPHGDPIPTRAGALPPRSGLSLASLPPGTVATIVHVEDEPREVYDRLRAMGFDLGVPLKLVEAGTDSMRVLVAGVERTFDPVLAGNVTVDPVLEQDGHVAPLDRLDALRPGERARVAQIAPTVQGPQRRRLLDLGVLPGTEVAVEMEGLFGDPVAYRIRGALIALRRSQAHGIYITQLPSPAVDESR